MKKVTQKQADQFIAKRTPFIANSLKADWFRDGAFPTMGQLPHTFQRDLLYKISIGYEVYVVFSYVTPIAWYCAGEWTIPETKYSVTTSKHQTIVKRGAK